MKAQGKICFGLYKILARYLLRSQEDSVRLVFSTLCTTLPINLIFKKKLLDLIERPFQKIFKNERYALPCL